MNTLFCDVTTSLRMRFFFSHWLLVTPMWSKQIDRKQFYILTLTWKNIYYIQWRALYIKLFSIKITVAFVIKLVWSQLLALSFLWEITLYLWIRCFHLCLQTGLWYCFYLFNSTTSRIESYGYRMLSWNLQQEVHS